MQKRHVGVCVGLAVLLHMLLAYGYLYKNATLTVAAEAPKGVVVQLVSHAQQNLLVAEMQKQRAAKESAQQVKKIIKQKVVNQAAKHKTIVKPVLMKAQVKIPVESKATYTVQTKKVAHAQIFKIKELAFEKVITQPPVIEAVKMSPVAAYTSADAGKALPAARQVGSSKNQKPIEMNNAMRRYLGRLMRHLIQYKYYPANLKKEHIEGKPIIRFSINAKGVVTIAEVKKSSGNEALDHAALAVFNKASPLPKIPKSMSRDTLTMSLPIEYSLIND